MDPPRVGSNHAAGKVKWLNNNAVASGTTHIPILVIPRGLFIDTPGPFINLIWTCYLPTTNYEISRIATKSCAAATHVSLVTVDLL